jgi:hypothetical protein
MNVCRYIGVVLLIMAGCTFSFSTICKPEKEAVYLFGHWINLGWEIQIPGLVLGILLTLVPTIASALERKE